VYFGVPIEKIVGVNQRRNDDLLQMLNDFVSERHAAGRPVPAAVCEWIEGSDPADRF
jgi:hypothetical protein